MDKKEKNQEEPAGKKAAGEAAKKIAAALKRALPVLKTGSEQILTKASAAGEATENMVESKLSSFRGVLGIMAIFGAYSALLEVYNYIFAYDDYFWSFVLNMAPLIIIALAYAVVRVAAFDKKTPPSKEES